MKQYMVSLTATLVFSGLVCRGAVPCDLTPAEVRESVFGYLEQKAGPAPKLQLPVETAPTSCARQWREALKTKNPKLHYQVIHGQLALAQKMLQSKVALERVSGLTIALDTSYYAIDDLQDKWLAPRICEGFTLPYLRVASPHQQDSPSQTTVAQGAASVYRKVGDGKKLLAAYRLYLDVASTPNTYDAALVRLADELQKQGQYDEALELADMIDPKGSLSGARDYLIGIIRKKLKN
jgi:tetratricopeptide (TPR) repeat protein